MQIISYIVVHGNGRAIAAVPRHNIRSFRVFLKTDQGGIWHRKRLREGLDNEVPLGLYVTLQHFPLNLNRGNRGFPKPLR